MYERIQAAGYAGAGLSRRFSAVSAFLLLLLGLAAAVPDASAAVIASNPVTYKSYILFDEQRYGVSDTLSSADLAQWKGFGSPTSIYQPSP